jgi:hypothetical protein
MLKLANAASPVAKVESPMSVVSPESDRPSSRNSSAPPPHSSTTLIRAAECRFVNGELARAISDRKSHDSCISSCVLN